MTAVAAAGAPGAFPPIDEAQFRAYRMRAIYSTNLVTYPFVAFVLVMFNGWDWYLDAANAPQALLIRLIGALLVLAGGYAQRRSARESLSPMIAKLRLLATSTAIAGALAVLDRGFVYGLAGLVTAMLGSSFVAIDRRDVWALYLPPIAIALVIMGAGNVPRFDFINAAVFLGLTLAVGWLLAAVMEIGARRTFQLEQALHRESRTDALTGAHNRRALEELGIAAMAQARERAEPLSVLLVDIDEFKQINDTHGHDVGDAVLQAIAQRAGRLFGADSAFGRWGGEEFLGILPGANSASAARLAETLRAAVAEIEILAGDAHVRPRVSVGVATWLEAPPISVPENARWTMLVKRADDAMYRAKFDGRNRVVVSA
jgi:diguanylate cyclase (GGDEF)-like protein